MFGKPLKGKLGNYWRYKVGKYRIIAEIKDNEIKVLIIKIGIEEMYIHEEVYNLKEIK